ncbi:MAG: prepilin-type N-terminal cleavage/methylation domain-containing protein [Deltaproteobacteria bacterium]|nr:prepilin-type N-terminal cleavage/methylation domain-containing protein [Deltaproteobacteria bacterium]
MKSSGFTMIELLLVVVVIGILAAIAIPQFNSQSKKAKASEVPGMFTAIKTAQFAYKSEYGMFLSTGSTETDFYPALLSSGEPVKKKWEPASSSKWVDLGVQPPDYQLYCGYVTIGGSAGTGPSGTHGQNIFRNTVPTKPWFYIVAACDLDGRPTTNTTYITSSDVEKTVTRNNGN